MTKDSIDSIGALLDGQLSDKEFEAELDRSRFLIECKKKGFEESTRLGLISKPVKQERRQYVKFRSTTKEKAIQSVHQIKQLRSTGMQAKEACFEVGVSYQTYSDWACKLELKFEGGRADYRKKQGIKL